MRDKLSTVNAVIDQFGGTGATAKLFGIRPSAVSNWRALGEFPARLHYLIAQEAESQGLDVDRRLFGLDKN